MEVAEGEFVRDDRLDGGEQARGIGVFNYRVAGERLAKLKKKRKEKKRKRKRKYSLDFLFGGGELIPVTLLEAAWGESIIPGAAQYSGGKLAALLEHSGQAIRMRIAYPTCELVVREREVRL